MTKIYLVWLLWCGAFIALLTGYGDLVRGGITLGPVLLSIGYCALIPAAIWRTGALSRDRSSGSTSDRPAYLAAFIAAAAVFALYVLTLAPTTALWDTSEYIAAAYTVGIPHPPGNPLFVIIGRTFAVLPIAPSVAARINLLAAVCSAAAAGFWFLVAERALHGWFGVRWQRIVGAGAAVAIGATAFTVWNQSVVNEKVYTISLLGIAACSWLMVRWLDDPAGRRADTLLVLVAYLTGLGFSNQMSAFLIGPAALVAILSRRPRTLLRLRFLLVCLVALGAGMSVFATQPIRSAFAPPINEGEPTACAQQGEGFSLGCTFTRTTWERFKYNFNREQYGKPPLSLRQAPLTAQIGMWWQYFRWQWLRDPYGEHAAAQSLLAATFLMLGLYGAVLHFERDRRTFWYFGTLTLTLSVLLAYYMNFKYGASQAPGLGNAVPREVRDRDYFFIWSFSAWGVWAGLGVAGLWQSAAGLARRQRTSRDESPRSVDRAWVATSPVLLIALVPLLTNWDTASRAGQTDARDFAHDLLNSVEPYAILVTAGDNDTFPLWYAQEVEGVRRDVLVVINELLNTDWHLRQAIRRRVDEYDAEKGPAIYRDGSWTRPTGPAAQLTEAEADSLPILHPIRQPMTFRKAGVSAVIDPARLMRDEQGTGYLERADVAILRMIADSWPQRPVYFARTAEADAHRLGLGPWLMTQGLARKLVPEAPTASRDTLPTEDGWFDLARTRALWTDVFQGPRAFAVRDGWVDRPSVGIPYLYVVAGFELAAAERAVGRAVEGDTVEATARRIAAGVRILDTAR